MGQPALSNTLVFHPLAMNSYRHWRGLRGQREEIDVEQRARARVISLMSPLWAPVRALEDALYGRLIAEAAIHIPPLFVLGHWRTGTTHLHNLLCQDPALGYVNTFQTVAPASFLVGRYLLQPLVARTMPRKRPMDNVPLGPELPQEEEMAMANLSPHSFYAGWYFPRRMPELFSRYVLFEDVSAEDTREWEQAYLTLLKKAAHVNPGKRLALKSPTNTGRIPQLLKLFPDAKFVHIHRDPYRVYKSTVHLHEQTCGMVGFHQVPRAEVESNVLSFFGRMARKYEQDKALIPEGNLVEIAYEQLNENAVGALEQVYHALGLPGWHAAVPHMKKYLASQAGYEKNVFRMDLPTIERIEAEWGFEIQRRGYPRPEIGA